MTPNSSALETEASLNPEDSMVTKERLLDLSSASSAFND